MSNKTVTVSPIEQVDALIKRGGPYMPWWGWHDDHRGLDKVDGYRPALQQVRSEYAALLEYLKAANVVPGTALQLGIGVCRAPHDVLRAIFGSCVSIDWTRMLVDDFGYSGGDTHDERVLRQAAMHAPYDFLFIDAGHLYDDVAADYRDYAPLVRPGGVIAFDDALPREGYEEVKVWKFLQQTFSPAELTMMGSEVGIAALTTKPSSKG